MHRGQDTNCRGRLRQQPAARADSKAGQLALADREVRRAQGPSTSLKSAAACGPVLCCGHHVIPSCRFTSPAITPGR